ncbi:glycosyl transferase [Rhodococcus spongiicola]|uniref:Glycosyl transferase n=1 Tax=Rhodococcus spongiicola TaxID=2487352 RepID=A0A3S3BFN9_9NOCA|nr:glycosyl transferase [Rhodococcus spongiicola]RVW00093.1 glycosyl transferase [Rhodococcus spongiicola]
MSETLNLADGKPSASPPTATSAPTRARRVRLTWADVVAPASFVALAVFVLWRQWRHLGDGYLITSGQDQTMWEWFFAVTAHSLTHLENPLSSTLQNYPLGVNMMANTAMFGVSIPLAPITLLFGPTVTFAFALTLGLAGTATAWYWVLSRHVVASKFAAAVGGVFCGFAPAMISHSNGHPNFVALFLLPFIALLVIRLGSGERPVRNGVLLGLVVAYQILLGEEPLLIYSIAFIVFGIAYGASHPGEAVKAALRGVKGLCVAGAVALAIVAVPLWWQFFGPQSYRVIEHGPVGNDALAFTRFPTQSLAGDPGSAAGLSMNATEENAFFGWPLLLLVSMTAVWLWRLPMARAAAATVAVMAVLSMGVELTVAHNDTGITLPWSWFAKLPLLESVLESRFAMGCIPAIAILLALGTDRAIAAGRIGQRPTTLLWVGWLVVALLPLAPTPAALAHRAPAPDFFAVGTWRSYVSDGSVVMVPPTRPEEAKALQWQVQQNFGFPIAGGYFVGPAGPEAKGKYGPDDRPTSLLLGKTQQSGVVPPVDSAARADARADLEFWDADVLVLPPGKNDRILRATVNQLLGIDGTHVDGVWVWDVRNLT